MPIVNKKSKEYKSKLVLSEELKQIIIGLLLGDGNMQTFTKTGVTWRLIILQGGDIHLEYIKHLRKLFDDWTVMPIRDNHEINKSGTIYKNDFLTLYVLNNLQKLDQLFINEIIT